MAIAPDAISNPGATFTGTTSWTHTPVGIPRGVFVQIFNVSPLATNEIASVTYGGVAVTNIGVPGLYKATGEPAGLGVFFRGTTLPAGPQTVTVTVSGATVTKAAACRTFTGAADIEKIAEVIWSADSLANPTGTLTLAGRTAYCIETFMSGHAATTSITPLANWSGAPSDFGVNVAGEYTYNVIGSANVTVGWTQAVEDATGFAYAFAEVVVGGTGVGTSAGLATAAATGRSTVARVATATATSTASAVGRSTARAVFTIAGDAFVLGRSPGATGGGGPITTAMGDLLVWALKQFPPRTPMNTRKRSLNADARAAFPTAATASLDDALHRHLDGLWTSAHP